MNSDWIAHPPKLYRKLFPGGLWRIFSSEKKIYLTFDDGPCPKVTPHVLDILDRYGIHATFFMVGENVKRYPEIYKEICEKGHAVGNHTMHHMQGLRVSAKEYIDDVRLADSLINSRLFRPPHGILRPSQLKELRESGFTLIMYDIVTRDYSSKQNKEKILERVKRFVKPGSIIVFHDSEKASGQMLPSLPDVIEFLKNQGYEFGVICE